MALQRAVSRPRDAKHTVLHTVIREPLEPLLQTVSDQGDGGGLPRFVEPEFRDVLRCGVLAEGFTRLRCAEGAFERRVPFSCQGRGVCPSCGGRRMAERAASLVDAGRPHVPIRQGGLTLPYRLRDRLAWDHAVGRAVLGVSARGRLAFSAGPARARGLRAGQPGTVTAIQRVASGVTVTVHVHPLGLDGSFSAGPPDGLTVHPASPPRDEEVAPVLATIRRRMRRVLGRRTLEPGAADTEPADPFAEASPVRAGLVGASVQGRVALGPRTGARVRRLGHEPGTADVGSRGPRQAPLDGFELHVTVWVPPNDRARLEQRCRSLLRPPLAQDRLHLRTDGRVLVTRKAAWRDGTTQGLFEPLEFLETLAALTPRPAIHVLRSHGARAPHARWRSQGVGSGRTVAGDSDAGPRNAGGQRPPRSWAWAALMPRALALDVVACPRCGGRLRLIATVQHPGVVRAILAHRGLAPAPDPPGPAPPQPDHAAATG
ncbi:MAG TPA: hypothetical protein DCQ64_02280 [Candidatus Rokubacteria bacterium]|nr:hypothetical protein [Candidatus Rokubacteria bacterium]